MRRTLAQIAGITAPQHYRNGGHVRGPGTGTSDSVNIKASNGEFILPTDTVRKVGVRRLQDLVDMTHEPTGKTRHPAQYADGGFVGLQSRTRRPGFDVDSFAQSMEQQRENSTQAAIAAGQAAQAEADAAAASRGKAPAAVAAPLENRVAQIPTGGQTAPAADGSQSSWTNTEIGRNVSNIAAALPGAGTMVRSGRMLGSAVQSASAAGEIGAINASGAALRTLALPAVGAATMASPSSAEQPGQSAQERLMNAGAGRGMVNPASVNPALPPPASPPRTLAGIAGLTGTTNDVTRNGNSYSGTNVSGDITVNGRAPGGGFMNTGNPSAGSAATQSPVGMTTDQAQRQGLVGERVGYNPAYDQRLTGTQGSPSPQNMAAAENLAAGQGQNARARLLAAGTGQTPGVQAPPVLHSGNDWQSRNDLRNAQVSASSITQSDKWGKGGDRTASAAYQALLGADNAARVAQPGVGVATMRESAGLQREGMQQAGETQRTGIRAEGVDAANQINRGRLTLEQIAAGYTNRSADRLDRAQAELEGAKTPEAQKSARERLMALTGKAPQNEWGVQVTPATKNADGSSTQGSVYRFNRGTGEVGRVDEGQGNAGQAPAKDNMVRGQVYQTRGGPMRWNGSSFERVG
ncbi:MAG: hypothetical protein Q8N13_22480 [Acidovorax sp.]|nr:hypothetical protein [Acidovorax sp.]